MTVNHFEISLCAWIAAFLITLAGVGHASERPNADGDVGIEQVYTVNLDRGEDIGQNFGTLFEVRSTEGQILLGAGFLAAYNTFDRADRHVLHVFERNEAPPTFETLPRVNDDAGVYLFDRGGRVFARSAADGRDLKVRSFNETTKRWDPVEDISPEATPVADGLLTVNDRKVRYKNQVILDWPENQGSLGRPYYAQGQLILWNHFDREDARVERFLVWKWRPSQTDPLSPEAAIPLQLGKKGEFPYAMGQLNADILVTTNQGGVYRLRDDRWDTLRTPDGKSHQVYCSLNMGESLWLGHYPSGEILEYDGQTLRSKAGFPPVMPGVSQNAREAQTLTLFGGDVYAGIWPWAELWRLPPASQEWSLVRRMFSQPAVTTATTHPFEKETAARGPVLNQWGQRLTSLVPLGNSLFGSTSAKSSKPWSPEFDFLDEAARQEYGRVYRMRRPGHVAAPLRWTLGATRLQIALTPRSIRVLQDGTLVGEASRGEPNERAAIDVLKEAQLIPGRGLYGPAQLKSLQVATDPVEPTSRKK